MKKNKNTKNNNNEKCVPEAFLPPQKEDFRNTVYWRIFRIMAEFIEGFQFIADVRKSVAFFGSARIDEKNKYYQKAKELAFRLSKSGYSIVTGGGPGIMRAANEGAYMAKGDSIGLNIQLPKEQVVNKFVKKAIGFHYFFVRKVMFSFASDIYVFFPGGYGTLDEFFEMITLVQTNKRPGPVTIIVFGKDYWSGLIEWIDKKVLKEYKAISPEDLKIFKLVDSVDEAFKIIKEAKYKYDF
ncbi:Cytokinin riboside 5'-monophosphate phosphoribohydrolase [bacterium HR34]|nr:Cytokinin riboside 5'-monophosphate phosphoribohydrolase [bacterium HR34]